MTSRINRIALLASLALLVALAGSVLANRSPQVADEPPQPAASHGADDADTGEGATARDRLADAGIEADAAEFDDLAARYGVGGAVRLYAWADATGMTVDEVAALRDGDEEPVGWGRVAKDLGVHPGIGSIMGRGDAPDEPPGLENRPDRDDD